MAVEGKRNILFKIRDERNWPQHFAIRKNGQGTRCQISVDIGNLGAAHAANEHFLAGANNTGSESNSITDAVVLNDCHVLRYLIENCRTTDDVIPALERLIKLKALGGAGLNRGMIFLFMDREKGLSLECSSEDYSATLLDKGIYSVSNHYLTDKAKSWERKNPSRNTVIRKERITHLLEKYRDELSLPQILGFSRDRKSIPHSLCNDDRKHFWMTISVAVHVIDRECPGKSFQLYCCGNTGDSVYLPISLGGTGNHVALLSGEFYDHADTLYRKRGCSGLPAATRNAFEREAVRQAETGDFSGGLVEKAMEIIKAAGG